MPAVETNVLMRMVSGAFVVWPLQRAGRKRLSAFNAEFASAADELTKRSPVGCGRGMIRPESQDRRDAT